MNMSGLLRALMFMTMPVLMSMEVCMFMPMQIFHIMIMVLMLRIQDDMKITHIQSGLFYAGNGSLKAFCRKALQRMLQYLPIRSQIQKRRHRHISADSAVAFQI